MKNMTSQHNGYTIRRATPADESFLWQMLYYAAAMSGDINTAIANAQTDPQLLHYVTDWGQADDLGVIATTNEGIPIGAAWVRLGVAHMDDTAHVAADEPELAIAALPAYRNQGLGAQMLASLRNEAAGHYPAITLNVREDNPAVRLYKRAGFVTVNEMVNRVGGRSLVMRLPLNERVPPR